MWYEAQDLHPFLICLEDTATFEDTALLCEECCHETLWLKWQKTLNFLSCAKKFNRHTEIVGHCKSKTAFSSTIHLCNDDPRQADVGSELTCLQQSILPRCRIDND